MDARRGEGPPTLQARLEAAENGAVPRTSDRSPDDPVELLLQLESSDHLHRDRGLGRIYHLDSVSFRENRRSNSLHLTVQGNRLAAHVDHVSPLDEGRQDEPRYSLRRAAVHNVAGMAHDLVQLVRGRQGDHRSELDCEWVSDPSRSRADDSDLLDARAAWSVQLEARVDGTLDPDRLRAAMAWVLDGEAPVEVVDCPDDAALDAARGELYRQVVRPDEFPPLRACLARQRGGDILMLNCNHAATDAFGAMAVLDRIARAYAGGGDGGEPQSPLEFLAVRDLPVRPASAPVSRVKRAYWRLGDQVRDFFSQPARLAPDGPRGKEPAYGFHLVRLSAEETAEVIDLDQPDTSRNALLASIHLAIGQWNLERGKPGRQIGVLVPVNLRPPDWPAEQIANFSVTARVSTRRRHRSGPAAALKEVRQQVKINKRTRTGAALIAALQRAGLVALWAKQSLVVLQPLTRNRLVDTAMLAHLGWLEEAPSFGPDTGEVTELWCSVPARAPLAISIGAVTVRGRLCLTFRYPTHVLGAEGARRFADCYVTTLRQVASSFS